MNKPAFESKIPARAQLHMYDENDVAHMSGVGSVISLNGHLHFNIKSPRLFFIKYNGCNLAQ